MKHRAKPSKYCELHIPLGWNDVAFRNAMAACNRAQTFIPLSKQGRPYHEKLKKLYDKRGRMTKPTPQEIDKYPEVK